MNGIYLVEEWMDGQLIDNRTKNGEWKNERKKNE